LRKEVGTGNEIIHGGELGIAVPYRSARKREGLGGKAIGIYQTWRKLAGVGEKRQEDVFPLNGERRETSPKKENNEGCAIFPTWKEGGGASVSQ